MTSYSLSETRRQLLTVPDDIEHILADLPSPGSLSPEPGRIMLCGSGDSRAAAQIAASTARQAGADVEVVHPWQLTTGVTVVSAATTVALISASGTSDSIVATADSLRAGPATTVAITGAAASPLVRATNRAVVWRLSPVPRGPSPAVRTFAATYLTLARLFGQLPDGDAWLATTKASLGFHVDDCLARAPQLAGRPVIPPTFCGTGRHAGSAQFARSKVIEISGLLAVASDPDEWFHVDRHAAPPFGSLSVFTDDAVLPAHIEVVLRAAIGQGRQVAIVAPTGPSAPTGLPVQHFDTSALAPELRTLAGTVLGVSVALHIAEALGRRPFSNKTG